MILGQGDGVIDMSGTMLAGFSRAPGVKQGAGGLGTWLRSHVDRAIAVRDLPAARERESHQRKVKVTAAAIERGSGLTLYSCVVTDGVKHSGPFLARVRTDFVADGDAQLLAVLAAQDGTAFEILRAAAFLDIPVEINGQRVDNTHGPAPAGHRAPRAEAEARP